ncbi:MAG: Unknown protein, partial [uncultured Campylobacterales bacterium]
AGNTSPTTTAPYTDITDPAAPATPTITPEANGTITVSGQAEPDSNVTVVFPDGTSVTVPADENGSYGPVTSVAPQTSGDVNTSATDAAGNTGPVTTTPYIETVPPVITLLGDENVTVEAGSVYTDAGATADDIVDGNITGNIVTVSDVNASEIGIYTVTYDVNDSAGNAATQVTRTVNVVDTTAPTVVSITPDNNATDVAVDSNITIVFDENMTVSTINTTNITVEDSLSIIISGTIVYDDNTGVAVFNPTSDLDNYETYTVTVTTAVQDDAGNGLASNVTSSFTVIDGPCGCPDFDACN